MKVLLVDDDSLVNESIENSLQVFGLECVSFTDPLAALESYKKNKYDIVVTDFKMPVMDGMELFKNIKEINNDAYVIMISAFADEVLIQKSLDTGIFAFLKKPINIRELIRLCVYLKE